MIVLVLIVCISILIMYTLLFPGPVQEGFNRSVAMKDHDELIKIRAELDEKYKPLIQKSDGSPTDLLSRLTMLESDVSALKKNAMQNQKAKIGKLPKPGKF